MTAVEWLIKELNLEGYDHTIQQAKEMEKQQIIDAWNGGDYAYFYSKETGRDFADGNEYYNETYGSKGSDDLPKVQNKDSFGEISDEEITKLANEHILYNDSKRQWVIEGMKLYREQLRKTSAIQEK